MAIIFAGTSIADFSQIGGAVTTNTVAGNKAPYAREAMAALPGRGGITDFASKYTELWVSFYFKGFRGTLTSGNNQFLALYDLDYSLSNPLWALRSTPATELQVSYWNGTAYVVIGEVPTLLNNTLHRVDMRVKMANSGGTIEVYVDSTLVFTSGLADTLHVGAGINRMQFYKHAQDASTVGYFSGFIVADEDTRGMVFVDAGPTANGAEIDWTGSYADIDETGINDADFIAPTNTGDISTFVFGDIPGGLSEYDVKSVIIASRGQKGGSAPTLYDFVARVGGTNYFKSPEFPLPPVFGPSQAIFNANPATSGAWDIGGVEAAEFGVRAVA